jgi:hypothetical protein
MLEFPVIAHNGVGFQLPSFTRSRLCVENIRSLDMSKNGLSGTLPSSVFLELTSLRYFALMAFPREPHTWSSLALKFTHALLRLAPSKFVLTYQSFPKLEPVRWLSAVTSSRESFPLG